MKHAAILLVCLAALVALATSAHASILSNVTNTIVGFAKDTITSPDVIGGTATPTGSSIDFQKRYDIKSIPGLDRLDLYAGLCAATEAPGIRGITTVTVTNIKGTQLALGVRTRESEGATWVIDTRLFGQFGLEPIIEIQRPI